MACTSSRARICSTCYHVIFRHRSATPLPSRSNSTDRAQEGCVPKAKATSWLLTLGELVSFVFLLFWRTMAIWKRQNERTQPEDKKKYTQKKTCYVMDALLGEQTFTAELKNYAAEMLAISRSSTRVWCSRAHLQYRSSPVIKNF